MIRSTFIKFGFFLKKTTQQVVGKYVYQNLKIINNYVKRYNTKMLISRIYDQIIFCLQQ